jgi:hypothetical protein
MSFMVFSVVPGLTNDVAAARRLFNGFRRRKEKSKEKIRKKVEERREISSFPYGEETEDNMVVQGAGTIGDELIRIEARLRVIKIRLIAMNRLLYSTNSLWESIRSGENYNYVLGTSGSNTFLSNLPNYYEENIDDGKEREDKSDDDRNSLGKSSDEGGNAFSKSNNGGKLDSKNNGHKTSQVSKLMRL